MEARDDVEPRDNDMTDEIECIVQVDDEVVELEVNDEMVILLVDENDDFEKYLQYQELVIIIDDEVDELERAEIDVVVLDDEVDEDVQLLIIDEVDELHPEFDELDINE